MNNNSENVPSPPPSGPMLAIDTSTASMTMSLTDGAALLGERTAHAERNHSVRLLPELDALMREAGVRPRDLRAVAVGCGPGSYTGVRIGVTTAKTFAWALGLPVYAVSSLEALAYGGWRDVAAAGGAARAPAWIVPALDARRGQAYTALFAADAAPEDEREAGGFAAWRRLEPDRVLPFRAQVERWLSAEARPASIVFLGDVEGGFAELIEAAAAGSQTVVLRRPWAVAARDIAAIARRNGGLGLVREPHDLLPNYAQLAEAEAKLAAAEAEAAKEREQG